MTSTANMNCDNNGLDVMALGASPFASGGGQNGYDSSNSWFEALAAAWGSTLDNEAQKLSTMSQNMGSGSDQPSQIAELTAESLRFSFLTQSENTSLTAAGQSMQTVARKD